jgi:hypothetical protein
MRIVPEMFMVSLGMSHFSGDKTDKMHQKGTERQYPDIMAEPHKAEIATIPGNPVKPSRIAT